MSRLWPCAEFAEDQRFAKSIVTVHTLHRGMQTGTIAGMIGGAGVNAYRKYILKGKGLGTKTNSILGHGLATRSLAPFTRTVTNAAGLGALAGFLVMSGMLPVYMAGREYVEWQDRAWRILRNKGQVEVDDFAVEGSAVGAVTSFVPRWNKLGFTWLNFLGRTSVGGMLGVLGYLGWRYGVHGGRFNEDAT